MSTHKIGSIEWLDLTTPQAHEVRDFYQQGVGWTYEGVPMGAYEDYCMNEPEDGKTICGICHQQGVNAAVPSGWIPYITVANLDISLEQCLAHGGQVLGDIRYMGQQGRFAIIKDPSGAVSALYEHLHPGYERVQPG